MTDDRHIRRPKTPPAGVAAQLAAPEPIDDEVTGRYQGEELQAKRIERIERKHDKLSEIVGAVRDDLGELKGQIGEVRGQLQALPELVRVVHDSADRAAAREHVAYSAQVDVIKARDLAAIGDQADARRTRRRIWLSIVGAFTSGGGVLWLLQHLGGS